MADRRRYLLALAVAACRGGGDATDPDGTSSSSTTGTDATSSTSSDTTAAIDTSDGSSSDGSSSGAESSSSGGTTGDPWQWDLPPGFPEPFVPDDNPMSAAKVELGRHLFHDTRMSGGGTFSCATCHVQSLAFTDGMTTAIGETGAVHRRNSMSLANLGYLTTLTWSHPMLVDLERQALVPMFGNDPIELGLDSEAELVAALTAEPRYAELFDAAYPDDPTIDVAKVVYALSSFQRTIISGRSPFDRWFEGETDAISESAQRGYALFNGHPFECFHCHVGFNLTDATYWDPTKERRPIFHNTGLYNTDGAGAYPARDHGLMELTGDPDDMGKFRAPTLRNIAVTAPYMHDGSIATLDGVIDHYVAGGRTIDEGPDAGDGSTSPLKDPLITGFPITEQERADLLAFLESLTDEELLEDPAFADPWR